MASNYIIKKWQHVYGDKGLTEVYGVMWRIDSTDPRVDGHHHISISSYHTTKIHTLAFPTCGVTGSVRDFVDPQCREMSDCLTPFQECTSQGRSY